ncbi:protein argonaute-2-like [Dermacentor andersoni]|uniref:protein argonaute-2-like n=1 Tax=Dermacentor andersoni TaxID=34620 RepID=UPI002155B6BC|nr:protein argonaute-2-like [Dermacentor andersoni]
MRTRQNRDAQLAEGEGRGGDLSKMRTRQNRDAQLAEGEGRGGDLSKMRTKQNRDAQLAEGEGRGGDLSKMRTRQNRDAQLAEGEGRGGDLSKMRTRQNRDAQLAEGEGRGGDLSKMRTRQNRDAQLAEGEGRGGDLSKMRTRQNRDAQLAEGEGRGGDLSKMRTRQNRDAQLAEGEGRGGDLSKAMVSELLQSYCAERGLPKRVIVYRDGVSDGQFDIVRQRELAAVQAATAGMQAPGMSEPAVTFIVVQKRHHTRFMRDTEGKERSANIPPGTIVDRVVAHPIDLNFFLSSHGGKLGTSRPTHYRIVHDDANSSSIELQQLTYDLCHLVARCSRSVSTPAPVSYAHLAAFRAKHHIAGRFRTSHVRPHRAPSLQQYIDAVKVHENVANTMYFL